ncbi:DUF2236 domain-containing protein [Rathayibacter tritici]|nr:DUF2236 domain-containing protein [Rathayibacter tritici]PPG05950.1 DUF2236 domain-containing protein [Rathayibacter tritici]
MISACACRPRSVRIPDTPLTRSCRATRVRRDVITSTTSHSPNLRTTHHCIYDGSVEQRDDGLSEAYLKSEAIARDLIVGKRAFDMRVGFFLAYYRSFAVPRIADQLSASGEIARSPRKRSYDTALITLEIVVNGLSSPRGQKALDLLVRAHERVQAPPDDFRYVLQSFVVVPTRWIDSHGGSSLSRSERDALAQTFAEIGRRMGIDQPASSYDAAERFYTAYESENIAPSDSSRSLMRATLAVLVDRFPAPLRPLGSRILAALIDDDAVVRALHLPVVHPLFAKAVYASLSLVRARQRRHPKPGFIPGASGSSVYPSGYGLQDLGPEWLRSR